MIDKRPFQIPAYLQKYQSISSGGMKMEFITQENIQPEDLLKFMKFLNKLGWLSFNVDMIEFVDIEPLINIKIDGAKYDNGKSPSQRLKSVLYLIHQATGGSKENFQQYYDSIMEQLINRYKDKLGELQ
jgi:hypothetical protein